MNKSLNKSLWYFSAGWCGPCKQFGPVMESLAKRGMPIKKIDVDYTPDVVTRFNVKTIPTVILVQNDQEVDRFTEARTESQVINFFNQEK